MKSIASLLAIVTPALIEAEERSDNLAQRCESLATECGSLREDLYDSREEVARLRRENDSLRHRPTYNSEVEPLRTRVWELEDQLHKVRYTGNGKSQCDNLICYMADVGRGRMRANEKIRTIKDVRTITQWGLLETKKFVEGFEWEGIISQHTIDATCVKVGTPRPDYEPTVGEIIRAKLTG